MSDETNQGIPALRLRTIGSWGPEKQQARDEALRAENADIDALAEEFGLSQQTVAIIKDWKSGQFGKTEITRRTNANIRTVSKWVSIVDSNWRLREYTQNNRPLSIKAAILDYPDEPDDVIASFFKIRPATVKYFRQGLETTRQKTAGKDRRAPLSIAERKVVLEELFREPRPIARLIAQKVGLREDQTISELAHQYWIILGKTGTTIDLASLLEAAQKQIEKYYLETSQDIKLAIEELAKQPGWISQLDAMKPWPDSPEFRHADAVLTYYLREASVKGPQDLQSRTDVNKILRLKMPEEIFLALNLALSGRAVIFNRRNLRRVREKGLHQAAPKNGRLAEFAPRTKSQYLSQTRRQARNEALRAADADVDAIAKAYGLSPKVVGIIKDIKSGRYGILRIAERNRTERTTVADWEIILKPELKEQRIQRATQQQAIKQAIRDNPDKSDSFIAGLFENVSTSGVGSFRRKMGLVRPDSKPRRPSLTIAERKAVLTDLMYYQDRRPSSSFLVNKHDLGNQRTVFLLAHEFWVPKNPSDKVFDVTLFLDAAQSLVYQHLADAPDSTKNAINALAGQSGWISRLESLKPWPESKQHHQLDATLTYYLREAGVKSPEDLQFKTEAGHILTLRMPEQIFLALQFTFAGRLALLNRRLIRRLSDGSKPIWAPDREALEQLFNTMMSEGRITIDNSLQLSNFPTETTLAATENREELAPQDPVVTLEIAATEITTSPTEIEKVGEPVLEIPVVVEPHIPAINTRPAANGITKPVTLTEISKPVLETKVPEVITDSPFAARFRKVFPTLAEYIPTNVLAKKKRYGEVFLNIGLTNPDLTRNLKNFYRPNKYVTLSD